jgi:3-phenylpropionate/cinnamic acid dioxygenase small subunit
VSMDLTRSVEAFLIHEARLLDAGAMQDWLNLYDDDAVYWVPASPGQTDPLNHVSIMYEDKPVLAMRVERLSHPRAYAVDPAPRATHLVSNVTAAQSDDGLVDAEAAFMMTESRAGGTKVFSGRYTYRLAPSGDGFRIKSKRVDLMDCDAVHGLITLPF